MAILLQELELLRETTDEAIEWWEELVCYFAPNDEMKKETGNQGEKLSREYEKERVGSYPHWESKFSSFSGYDLLSTVSYTNQEKLHIEVKSAQHSFVFYLTRGEWKKAQETVHYVFHFWHLAMGELYIFTPHDISHHVSVNQGNGEWTVCEIELSKEEQMTFREKTVKTA
ncbi:protein NO VEIN domain-containing protein [Bacillus sp. S14(2024)]|uniref:protein NO VEIN domain-containing protein n=1 Tax=Bacillus sp. S14(2024) TaxID=3162884 RepID=UPI003D1FEA68